MRHAMLMCAHTNFNMLQMFIDLYDDERYDFYILIDKKILVNEKEVLKRYPTKSKAYFCPRIEISWAGYSQIEANLLLFEESIKKKYDYYHYFQGSDFPIKTCDEVDEFFEKNKGKQFIEIYQKDFSKIKCGYYHFFTNNRWYRKNVFVKAANKILLFVQKMLKIKRNNDIDLYHGSALTSLSHECVMYILSKRAEIKKRFNYTLAADEVFLQTMIAKSPFREDIYKFEKSMNANVRMIDWDRREGNSPYTFCLDDYEKLISADEDICFARKFSENVDFEVVKKLYDYLRITRCKKLV